MLGTAFGLDTGSPGCSGRKMLSSRTRLLLGFSAFLIAGAVTRLLLRTVESRVQIVVFCAVALAFELALSGRAPRWRRFLLNAAAASVGIVGAKFALEGLPEQLVRLLHR